MKKYAAVFITIFALFLTTTPAARADSGSVTYSEYQAGFGGQRQSAFEAAANVDGHVYSQQDPDDRIMTYPADNATFAANIKTIWVNVHRRADGKWYLFQWMARCEPDNNPPAGPDVCHVDNFN